MSTVDADRRPEEPEHLRPRRDRWLIWPAIFVITLTFAFRLVVDLPETNPFFVLPLFVLFLLVLASLLILGIWFHFEEKLRKAISVLVAIPIAIVFWQPLGLIAQETHLVFTVWIGLGQIGAPPKYSVDHQTVYNWSTGIFFEPEVLLIREPRDRLPRRPEDKASRKSDQIYEEDCNLYLSRLYGHYFVCTIDLNAASDR